MKAYISTKRDHCPTRRIFPCPFSTSLSAFLQRAIFFFPDSAQCDSSLVPLQFFVHHIENPLCSGQCCQQEIDLHCKLIDRHRTLPDVNQIRCKASEIHHPLDHKQTTYTCRNRIIDIGEADDCRNQHSGILKCTCGSFPEIFISFGKFFKIHLFMVKHFFDFLSIHHLLDKSVDLT